MVGSVSGYDAQLASEIGLAAGVEADREAGCGSSW